MKEETAFTEFTVCEKVEVCDIIGRQQMLQ